ncbi:heat shock cognate 70 kDa protein [Medicago truncatula]|uniref:heat shock cognate 70 kDa protein n=1 Tax=Medicago truncatula TaxID=3880 RepID=UPI000D2F393C|nr:heat shock cognate 70 kDa protein [Medicago truncatula]
MENAFRSIIKYPNSGMDSLLHPIPFRSIPFRSISLRSIMFHQSKQSLKCSVLIRVYEGERARASDNYLLGSFGTPCLPCPRGQPLEVCFSIDENGILTVTAKEISTDNMNVITITNGKERLSTLEIEKMIKEAEKYHVEDMQFVRKANVMSALDSCVYNMKNTLKKKVVNLMLFPSRK